MIQINLVPDVKQEMLRAQRVRNVAISFSILAGVIAVGAVATLALVLGAQAVTESLTSNSITREYEKLAGTKDINNALTIQNQLKEISSLNGKRTIDSRLFDVLAAINPAVPNDTKLSKVTLDPTQSQLMIEGSAVNGYPATEAFRKTILNTKVSGQQNGQTVEVPLTDEVTIQNTSYGQDTTGAKVVRFTLYFKYPEGLFDNSMTNVRIITPTAKVDVTDSKTRVPDSMFSQAASDIQENN